MERNTIGKSHTITIQRQVIVNLERRLNVKRAPRAHRLFVWFRFFQTSEETWSKSMTALLCNSHFESLHSLDTVLSDHHASRLCAFSPNATKLLFRRVNFTRSAYLFFPPFTSRTPHRKYRFTISRF